LATSGDFLMATDNKESIRMSETSVSELDAFAPSLERCLPALLRSSCPPAATPNLLRPGRRGQRDYAEPDRRRSGAAGDYSW
jgi:hypothetical protein